MTKFLKGKYKPKNPQKYIGDVTNIVFRSSWELGFLRFLDHNPAVKKFNSEGVVIPYVSPIDNKVHRYYVDFLIEYADSKNETKRALIEVKPYTQTQQPKPPKKRSKYYITEVMTYQVNMSKWKQAVEFCKKNDMDFVVLTERGAINFTSGDSGYKFLTEGEIKICLD